MGKLLCGIDLGGTKINTGLVNKKGEVVSNIIVDTLAQEGQERVIARMMDTVRHVMKEAGISCDDLEGIGIGVPGLIDSWEGLVIEAANLPGWENVPIVDLFAREFNIPILLENDANAAAMGEYLFGSGRGNEDFVYVTISTGIGGGAILDGRLYSGSNSNATEIGHSMINFDGPRCKCGNSGCFEAYASGTSLARFATERIEAGEETIIKRLAVDGLVKAEHVFEANELGDVVAEKLIQDEAYYIGIGLANILAFYNPEKISIGGGVSSQWHILEERVKQVVAERALKPNAKICKIVKAELGKNVGLLGAAGIVLNR